MKKQFRRIRLNTANKIRLDIINNIIEEYQKQGYVLTLRQLYYQLVTRDVIPNKQSEYSKLSTLLKEGRMGGIVDWSAIEDRLRNPKKPASFESPEEILDAAILQYELPRQDGQETYLEVWVEKDALSGVLSRVTEGYHVPILVNRGYSSVSAMYDAFRRFEKAHLEGKQIKILYLGDYDPSGIDMIRDIQDRVLEFATGSDWYMEQREFDFSIEPIALTREQIDEYNPPPNPAKKTDPRAKGFIEKHGSKSWEVDALKPEVLHSLLNQAIMDNIDFELYKSVVEREDEDKKKLESLKEYL